MDLGYFFVKCLVTSSYTRSGWKNTHLLTTSRIKFQSKKHRNIIQVQVYTPLTGEIHQVSTTPIGMHTKQPFYPSKINAKNPVTKKYPQTSSWLFRWEVWGANQAGQPVNPKSQDDCEHVSLHRCLRSRHGATVVMAPWLAPKANASPTTCCVAPWMHWPWDAVDGSDIPNKPAVVYGTLWNMGIVSRPQLVQDSFHQQYWGSDFLAPGTFMCFPT